jgi:hypothetical protein
MQGRQIIITNSAPFLPFFFTCPVEKSANAGRTNGCCEIHSFQKECEDEKLKNEGQENIFVIRLTF